jgi:hypothetical protein
MENLTEYLRLLPLIAGVLFGACSCSQLAGDSDLSKPEQIICQVGPDCDLKWERAYTWVVESSGLKLKTKTDGFIKTAESSGDDRTLVVTIRPRSRALTRSISFENVRVFGAAFLPARNPAQDLQILF